VLCTVYTKYPKVMTKRNVDGLLVSLILFMQFSTCKFGIRGKKIYTYLVFNIGMKFLPKLLQ